MRSGMPVILILTLIAACTPQATSPIQRAELNYTCQTGRWQDRKWETIPAEIEKAAHKPARGLADHHAAGLCERLEPRREIRRLADYGVRVGRFRTDQVAYHHRARGDTHPHL